MTKDKNAPGLGELLRYVSELVDQGADQEYRALELDYRARYTPVLRAIAAGAETVTDITAQTHLTQGAVSQVVTLLTNDGILTKYSMEDARKSGLRLTQKGRSILRRLEPHWSHTFSAIEELEAEIGYPLRSILKTAGDALERQGFGARVRSARDKARGKSTRD